MSITQIFVFDLDKGTTNEKLAHNESHTSLLELCTCMQGAGCNGIIWSVTEEDLKVLVWLIEWQYPATESMITSRKKALDQLQHRLHEKRPDMILRSDRSYILTLAPSKLLSSAHPVLEVFQYHLNEGVTFEQHQGVMKPVTDHWKQEGRLYAVSPARHSEALDVASTNEQKEEGRNCVFVVPWQSVEEHMNAIEEDYFQKAIKAGDKMQTPKLFAHIRPICTA